MSGPEWLNNFYEYVNLKVEFPLKDHNSYNEECKNDHIICLIPNDFSYDINRYSTLTRAKNVMRNILKWKKIVTNSVNEIEDLEESEKKLIFLEQRKSYPLEIDALDKGNLYQRKSTISQLKPFLDNDKYLRAGAG